MKFVTKSGIAFAVVEMLLMVTHDLHKFADAFDARLGVRQTALCRNHRAGGWRAMGILSVTA